VFAFSFWTKRQTDGGRGMLPGITTQEKSIGASSEYDAKTAV
jgi:hypothetical protein